MRIFRRFEVSRLFSCVGLNFLYFYFECAAVLLLVLAVLVVQGVGGSAYQRLYAKYIKLL